MSLSKTLSPRKRVRAPDDDNTTESMLCSPAKKQISPSKKVF